MRIVVDTNTLVSGFGWGGPPGQVVDAVVSGQARLVTSPALLAELARVMAYPKLSAVLGDPAAIMAAVAAAADPVDPAERISVLDDEPDNRVLEAATAGRADLIVTGDNKAMRALGSFRGIPIISAAECVARLPQHPDPGLSAPGGAREGR